MATVILDTIKGAQREAYGVTRRNVRTGQVKDIAVTGESDSSVLAQAESAILEIVGPMGTMHDSNDGTRLARLLVRSIPSVSDRVSFELHYETSTNGVTSSLILRDGSVMTSYNTRFLPGANRGVRLVTNDITDTDGQKIKANSVDATFLRPVRTITATGVVYGNPPANMRAAMGKVNNAEWQGLPTGYWLVMAMESDVSQYGGYYTFSTTVATKNNEDWSDVLILIDPLTGLPVKTVDATVTAAMSSAYSYGNHPGDGFTRVGPYETTNFSAIFGIN